MSSNIDISLKYLSSPKSAIPACRPVWSESRYNTRPEESVMHPIQEFSIKEILPKKSNSHNRVLSTPISILTPDILFGHSRQRSLGQKPFGQLYDTSSTNTPKIEDNENNKYCYHSRKGSDCDMVLYGEKDSINSQEVLKRSLPVFGSNPCTAYCRDCNREVHTKVEFIKKNPITFGLLDLISSFFACCGEPNWMLRLRVHKCEVCGRVLARSCK
jgi:hypothetical protein